jgi:hypothetical protein
MGRAVFNRLYSGMKKETGILFSLQRKYSGWIMQLDMRRQA